jgi:vacuolar-type H+-ATPase subunit H
MTKLALDVNGTTKTTWFGVEIDLQGPYPRLDIMDTLEEQIKNKLSDAEFEAWLKHSDLERRLAATKSNILKAKRSRPGVGDIKDANSDELERLRALKVSLEDRIGKLEVFNNERDYSISDLTKYEVDKEALELVTDAYENIKELLHKHHNKIEKALALVIEKTKIDGTELKQFMSVNYKNVI